MVFEHTLKASDLFVTESKIITHARSTLEFHFIDHIVGERKEALSRCVGCSRKIGFGFSLRHILGPGKGKRRHFCLCQVVDRCE